MDNPEIIIVGKADYCGCKDTYYVSSERTKNLVRECHCQEWK